MVNESEETIPLVSVTVHVSTDDAERPAETVACTVVEAAFGVAIKKFPAVAPVVMVEGNIVQTYVNVPDPPVTVLVNKALICLAVDNKVGVGLFDSMIDTCNGR
jgi:hypothetical protein